MWSPCGVSKVSLIDIDAFNTFLELRMLYKRSETGKMTLWCLEKLLNSDNNMSCLSCLPGLNIVDNFLMHGASMFNIRVIRASYIPICVIMWGVIIDSNRWDVIFFVEVLRLLKDQIWYRSEV